MSLTIIGDSGHAIPIAFTAPQFFVKEVWGDSWIDISARCELLDMTYCTAGQGDSECQFRTRYGNLKNPLDTDISFQGPLDLRDYWLKVVITDPDAGEQIAFMGLIYNDVRDVEGSNARITGKQPWVAQGPSKVLKNIDVSRSLWLDDGNVKDIGWLPSKNMRDARKFYVGNRSADRGDGLLGAYLYGGKDLWTNLQHAEYTLESYAFATGGPAWNLGGDTDALDGIVDSTEFGDVTNVFEILRKLIDLKFGLDFKFTYHEEGFGVEIFSLLEEDSTFGTATLGSNPDVVQVYKGDDPRIVSVRVVRTRENMYDRFRLIGGRIVICASLGGDNADFGPGEMIPSWGSALEADYVAAADDDQRKRSTFRDVYQKFAAPVDYDYRGGALAYFVGYADGELDGDGADFQNTVRKTLNWLPLREGFDYSSDPATDNREVDADTDFQRPMVFLEDGDPDSETFGQSVEADQHGVSVTPLQNDLGVYLGTSPNHVMAKGTAFNESSAESDTSDVEPKFDYRKLIATIAWHSDQVLHLGFDVDAGLAVGDGSIKMIHVPDAEFWVLAPNTVVGIDPSGGLLESGIDIRVLRSDVARLEQIAAGEIARYVNERIRAEIVVKGHCAWAGLLGQIVNVVEPGVETFPGSCLTMIRWTGGMSPGMELRTGYA